MYGPFEITLFYIYLGIVVSWVVLPDITPELYRNHPSRAFKYFMILVWPLVLLWGIAGGVIYIAKNLGKWLVKFDDSMQRGLSRSSVPPVPRWDGEAADGNCYNSKGDRI